MKLIWFDYNIFDNSFNLSYEQSGIYLHQYIGPAIEINDEEILERYNKEYLISWSKPDFKLIKLFFFKKNNT